MTIWETWKGADRKLNHYQGEVTHGLSAEVRLIIGFAAVWVSAFNDSFIYVLMHLDWLPVWIIDYTFVLMRTTLSTQVYFLWSWILLEGLMDYKEAAGAALKALPCSTYVSMTQVNWMSDWPNSYASAAGDNSFVFGTQTVPHNRKHFFNLLIKFVSKSNCRTEEQWTTWKRQQQQLLWFSLSLLSTCPYHPQSSARNQQKINKKIKLEMSILENQEMHLCTSKLQKKRFTKQLKRSYVVLSVSTRISLRSNSKIPLQFP